MKHIRKIVLTAAAAIFLPGLAAAQQYPQKDISFVVGYAPGSGADIITRFFAEKIQKASGRTVIVENKPGAAGNIATEFVARSNPDGYTVLLAGGSATAAGMHLTKNPPVDVVKTLQIAATINKQAFLITVPSNSPYKTLADLTAAMKAKGDKASYATTAPTGIVLGEMYKAKTGVQAAEVRYRNASDALNEFTSGKLDYGALDPVFTLAQQREGRLRVLAQSSDQPLEALAGIPTMKQAGVPDVNLMSWWAMIVPAGTPRPAVDRINAWMREILAMPDTKKFLTELGGDPFVSTPEEGQALFVSDERAWKNYVALAKIVPQ